MRAKLPGTIGMLGKGVCKFLLTPYTNQVESSFINANAFHISASHKEILLTAGVREFTRCGGHISNTLTIVSDMTPQLMKGHLGGELLFIQKEVCDEGIKHIWIRQAASFMTQ